jgi:hypothetical protein
MCILTTKLCMCDAFHKDRIYLGAEKNVTFGSSPSLEHYHATWWCSQHRCVVWVAATVVRRKRELIVTLDQGCVLPELIYIFVFAPCTRRHVH